MKICRFLIKDQLTPSYGVLTEDRERITLLPRLAPQFAFETFDSAVYQAEAEAAASSLSLAAEVRMLSPLAPSKIVGVGRNYSEHAKELGNEVPSEPLLFLKAPSSLIVAGEAIVIPPHSNQVEHEGELGVVIKRTAKNLSETDDALAYVFGYTCLNDVTARDLQRRDVQFTRAKSFDTFCPINSFVETDLNPDQLELTVRVNGAVKQSGNTAQMVFPVAALIRYISRQMTLLPGDLIATGTPAGVSRLMPGDVCEVEIEGLGTLTNPVR